MKGVAYDAKIDRETRRILVVRREKLNKSCTRVWWKTQKRKISKGKTEKRRKAECRKGK